MSNMELRWYNGVLQMRFQFDARAYAGFQPWPNPNPPQLMWSSWLAVPSVNEAPNVVAV
jgi:hypothetical protein